MAWIVQLFIARRRRNQHELACRAAEVVSRVLSDIGIDRFLNGTLLVDYRLRVRFVSCGVAIGRVHAAVRADTLAQARLLRAGDGSLALPAQALQPQVARLVEELMAALLSQSATLRALPLRRYRSAGRQAERHAERRAAASK